LIADPALHAQNSFQELVDTQVISAIYNGKTTFNGILLSLPGIYPSEVFKALHRLKETGKISSNILENAIQCTSCNNQDAIKTDQGNSVIDDFDLPVPHPLDYEWRFTPETMDYLLGKCLGLTSSKDLIGLMGVPSVLVRAVKESYSRKMLLFENNQAVIDHLDGIVSKDSYVKCDLTRDILPLIRPSIIICDPPWYNDYTLSFLWSACQLLVPNGFLLLSIPPLGTRPSIVKDWELVQNWADQLGLSLMNVEMGILSYVSPPFERNALKAEKLYNVDRCWRRSNLAMYVYDNETKIPRPLPPNNDICWDDYSHKKVRIRVKRNEKNIFISPKLIPVVPGDILPSVSNKDERRKYADVWTSGNRIFSCKGTNILKHIIDNICNIDKSIICVEDFIGKKLSREEMQQIIEVSCHVQSIIDCEYSEYVSNVFSG